MKLKCLLWITTLDFTFRQDANSTTNKKALLNSEIIHKFVLAILSRVKERYNQSIKNIRKHLSNNFQEFLPELFCYLMLERETVFDTKKSFEALFYIALKRF